jgi:hypothetical protein
MRHVPRTLDIEEVGQTSFRPWNMFQRGDGAQERGGSAPSAARPAPARPRESRPLESPQAVKPLTEGQISAIINRERIFVGPLFDRRPHLAPQEFAGMSTIPWLVDLQDLSPFETAFLVLIVIVACMASGFAVDAAMKNLGLGPISNGVVALIGVFAGVYLRYRLLGSRYADDVFVTIGFALGFAVILFLSMAFAKSRGFF